MECNFVVGQKVVMVRDFPDYEHDRAKLGGVTLPTFGEIYTIREIVATERSAALRFVELVNAPYWSDGIEPAFVWRLFQPVTERKTDISIFKAMLNPSKEGVPA